ncbi:unnamed protein product [Brachionus calyciflorus]|uniref:Uncharacterized protein n=1 Tax=Brachionus calyciflorus TaxID=104777 RepID=A0A814NJA6_9BILA|nr:unnamed protein product [Brachionus calyciflorus]
MISRTQKKSRDSNFNCIKCKTRLTLFKKSSFFRLKSEKTLEFANAFKPDLIAELEGLVCINCYMNGKRLFQKLNSYRTEALQAENASFTDFTLENNHPISIESIDLISCHSNIQKINDELPKNNDNPILINQSHLDELGRFNLESLAKIEPVKKEVSMDKEAIVEILDILREKSKKRCLFAEFADPTNEMRNWEKRSKSQALAVYLFWLKTNMEQETIAAFFCSIEMIDVSHFCQQIRDALMNDFVPSYLGSNIRTREDWVSQNSLVAKELYSINEDKLVFFADGKFFFEILK